jgi:hypothetical protein
MLLCLLCPSSRRHFLLKCHYISSYTALMSCWWKPSRLASLSQSPARRLFKRPISLFLWSHLVEFLQPRLVDSYLHLDLHAERNEQSSFSPFLYCMAIYIDNNSTLPSTSPPSSNVSG